MVEGDRRGRAQEMAAEEGLGSMRPVLQMEEGNLESHGQPLADGNVQQMDFPLEPMKVTQSCRKLDFSPVRPMSDFPQNCQIINLCSLSHRFCVQHLETNTR